MKKIVSLALALVLVLSLTACGGKDGGKSADPNLGKYIGTEYSGDGDTWYSLADLYDGECYIELKSDGKGVFCLGGEATDIKWSLESDGTLTLKRDGLESNGVLQDGCIMLGDLWGNEVYTLYEKEDADSSPEKTGDTLLDWWPSGRSAAGRPLCLQAYRPRYSDPGFWNNLRPHSPGHSLSARRPGASPPGWEQVLSGKPYSRRKPGPPCAGLPTRPSRPHPRERWSPSRPQPAAGGQRGGIGCPGPLFFAVPRAKAETMAASPRRNALLLAAV